MKNNPTINITFCHVFITLILLALANIAFSGEIHDAVIVGDLAKITSLLQANPELVSSKDKDGRTPLHYASFPVMGNLAAVQGRNEKNGGIIEITSVRNDKGAIELKRVSPSGAIKVDAGASNTQLSIVKLLIDRGAEVDVKNNAGVTPLFYAVKADRMDAAQLLLANKADANIQYKIGTVLHLAVSKGNKAMVELLLANNADVMTKDEKGDTPLHNAAYEGRLALVELLLLNKADLNAKDDAGLTPLHAAAIAKANKKEVASFLLANKADANAASKKGWTPLHLAASEGHQDIVELLLMNKADVNAKTFDNGHTALHLAITDGHREVAEYLRQHGGHE